MQPAFVLRVVSDVLRVRVARITCPPACFACISNTGTDHFIMRTVDARMGASVVMQQLHQTRCRFAYFALSPLLSSPQSAYMLKSPCTQPHSLQTLLHSKMKPIHLPVQRQHYESPPHPLLKGSTLIPPTMVQNKPSKMR